MKKILLLAISALSFGLQAQETEKEAIDALLTAWHQAAAGADFEAYFEAMTPESVFIGTDAGEHWDRDAFMAFSKPYFDQGKAWDFKALQRHIYLSHDGQMAWFDELLDTWMQLCRGSGVAVKTPEGWKIAHYVLSLTMPNETIEGAIALKKESDSLMRQSLLRAEPIKH
jgi:ketosteroid isomerase-like protein